MRRNSRNLQPRNEIFYAIHTSSDEIICMWVGSLTATTTRRYQLKICKAFTFRVHYVRMTNLFNCVFAKSLSRAQSAYTLTHTEKEREREGNQNFVHSFFNAVISLCSVKSFLCAFILFYSILFDRVFFSFFWFDSKCVQLFVKVAWIVFFSFV